MSVAAGREFLAIPGPTVIPDAVLAAMHRPAVDIYSGPLVALTDGLLADLSRSLPHRGPAPTSTPPTATAPGKPRSPTCCRAATRCWCWRAAASRIGWGEAAKMLGAEVEMLPGDFRRAVRPGGRRGAAAADTASARSRRSWWRRSTPPRACVNDIEAIGERRARVGPRRAADGRHRRVARLHAVRDGRVGRRRRDGRLAEGADDAAGPGLRRRRRRARARRTATPACARRTGTGPSATARCTTTNIAARRRSTCCSALRAALDMLFAEGLDNVFRAPPPAGGSDAPRGRRLGGRPGDRLQHRRSRRSAATP